jgi:hypothetical protein
MKGNISLYPSIQEKIMKKAIFLLCLIITTSCLSPSSDIKNIKRVSFTPEEACYAPEIRQHIKRVSFTPEEARYAPEIRQQLNLTTDEMALLQNNGFVVSERLAFKDFSNAYAYIYWKDLPVLITTDSILHAIHKTYDDLLMRLEMSVFAPQVVAFLTKVRQQVRVESRANPALAQLYADIDTYLSVPLALLEDKSAQKATTYLQLAQQANTIAEVTLFGGKRKIDFTLFKPRGHYLKKEQLKRYFRAMNWLAHIDFRLLEYDPNGKPHLNLKHIAAAALLQKAITKANQRTTWQEFDNLISAFVGRSDNTTLSDLGRFLADAKIETVGDVFKADKAQLLSLLTTRDYGQQQITGQLLAVGQNNPKSLSRPISFMLMGQRFTIDSYIMSNLVYDRLLVKDRKVPRALPSPLDVMYALGNDQAKIHLQSELAKYGYQDQLDSLRTTVEKYEAPFWVSSIYNRWLSILRTLNVDTTTSAYPQAMQTAAWADKMLHTQLASWTQLRHDNILYVKQSFTVGIACEYPTGYIEPYPAFYIAVQDYARTGREAIIMATSFFKDNASELRQTALAYFEHLDTVATTLQIMAEKELRLEQFTPQEEAFLKDTTILQKDSIGCGEVREEWNGWYPKLFPWKDESPALIVDIHTNVNNDLPPPRVLHVATGDVAAQILIVDTDEGQTMYVGPSFTYYKVIENGLPPVRLTDDEWKERLRGKARPMPPSWTASFRLPRPSQPSYLSVPVKR